MDLHKERILLTGAAGFVGACLTHRLVAQGIKPHVLLKPGLQAWRLKDIAKQIFIHEGDLLDQASLKNTVEHVRPTIIYHLATHGAYPTQTDAAAIINTNVLGTLHLLQALEGVAYKLFVNTGSSSEYGFKNAPMCENDMLAPNSFYAVAKACQTMLCQYLAAARKKNIVTCRLFSAYGPYEESSRLVPAIIRCCLKGQDLIMASPSTARDFIFIEDILDAFLAVHPLAACAGEILNLGTGRQTTLKEIVEEVLALTRANVQVRWNSMPDRIWDTAIWVGDPSKTAERLGWRAATPLKEGLSKTLEWFKTHE